MLPRIPEDPAEESETFRETLELLRAAEVEGKCRGGVLDPIDMALKGRAGLPGGW